MAAGERPESRTHGWQAFVAWTTCGLLWAFVYLGAFTVGGLVLGLAILLTLLLASKRLSLGWRLGAWVAFGLWVVWWVLVLAGPARDTTNWMVTSGVVFLVFALVGGPAALGVVFGAGTVVSLSAWGGGLEPRTPTMIVGLVAGLVALVVWLVHYRRHQHVNVPEVSVTRSS